MRNLPGKLFASDFYKFILVGIANTVFGTGIMLVSYHVFHFSYWISSASNYLFGSILSYILNRVFTFQNKERIEKTLPRFVVNIGLCYLLAYGAAKPFMVHVLSDFSASVQETAAMLTGMCLFMGLNYIGQRFFVFRKNTRPRAIESYSQTEETTV